MEALVCARKFSLRLCIYRNFGDIGRAVSEICDWTGKQTGRQSYTHECKKLQFIHTVNGDGSKTAKIIKKAMLTTLT